MSDARRKQELLHGPLAKIERAKKHVSDLDWQIGEYLAKSPFEFRIRQSKRPPQRVIYVSVNPAIPDDFALIIGDAVHNLRSALDHLCFGMVGDKAPTPRQVGFPFVERKERLAGAINTRQMNIASKHVIDEIHALKPYPDGNKYLHAVKAADERDKHHFILIVGHGISLTLGQLGSLVGPERIKGLGLGENSVVSTVGDFAYGLDGPVEVFDKQADFQPAFSIGFGEGEALAIEPVIPALKAMVEATEGAVRRLGRAWFR